MDFDSNVSPKLAWKFEPERRSDTIDIGGRDMAFFKATNLSGKPITGTATFNVTPAIAGKYFTKIQCFCFTQQTLQPGETVRMPVIFYVDPKILNNPAVYPPAATRDRCEFVKDLGETYRPLLTLSFGEVNYAEFLPGIQKTATRHRVKMPKEFILITKQLLYFDRYAKALAPKLNVFTDPRLIFSLMADIQKVRMQMAAAGKA